MSAFTVLLSLSTDISVNWFALHLALPVVVSSFVFLIIFPSPQGVEDGVDKEKLVGERMSGMMRKLFLCPKYSNLG